MDCVFFYLERNFGLDWSMIFLRNCNMMFGQNVFYGDGRLLSSCFRGIREHKSGNT